MTTDPVTHGPNAGIRRNRRKAGVKTVVREMTLAADTSAAIDKARLESGNLSLSLYLERLLHELAADQGALPVLAPSLTGMEVRHTNAA